MSATPMIDRLARFGAFIDREKEPTLASVTEAEVQKLVDEQIAISKIVSACGAAQLCGMTCAKCDEKIAAISTSNAPDKQGGKT